MDELQQLKYRLNLLHEKQNEIIERLNLVIAKINEIPRDIQQEKEVLSKKAAYFEQEIDRLKIKMNVPDDNV